MIYWNDFMRGAIYGVIFILVTFAAWTLSSCATTDGNYMRQGYLVKRSRCCTGVVIDFGPMTSTCEVLTPCAPPRQP